MSKFYEKLIAERDILPPNTPERTLKNDVLTKLFIRAFTNDEQPDELPKKFYIHNVFMTRNDFEKLLNRLNISADITVVNKSYFDGHIFEVTLKKV